MALLSWVVSFYNGIPSYREPDFLDHAKRINFKKKVTLEKHENSRELNTTD